MDVNVDVDVNEKPFRKISLGPVLLLTLAACTFNPDLGGDYFPCKPDGTCPGECVCLEDQVCVPKDGQGPEYCAWCEDGQALCRKDKVIWCAHLDTDPQNCGECGAACDDPPPPTCDGDELTVYLDTGDCQAGQCRYASSNKPCAHGCENGACLEDPCLGVSCSTNMHCESSSGLCVCDHLYGDCDTSMLTGCETYLNTIEDCGECERACGPDSICVEGECDCIYGFGNCNDDWGDGCEEDLLNNNLYCGDCDNPCDPGLTCCSGQCVDTKTDRGNCGRCNLFCSGMTDCCLGTCTETQLDEENCGGCGNACPDPFSTCCWGSCVDILTDDGNCGECSNACAQNIPCDMGACGAQGIRCGTVTCDYWEESCCHGPGGIGCYPVNDCAMSIVECDGDEDCGDSPYCCLINNTQYITQCALSCSIVVCSSDDYCRQHDPDNPYCCAGDYNGQPVNRCQSEICQ